MSFCHGTDVMSFFHGTDVMSFCHGTDVMSFFHGTDVMSFCHGTDVMSFFHGTDVMSTTHILQISCAEIQRRHIRSATTANCLYDSTGKRQVLEILIVVTVDSV